MKPVFLLTLLLCLLPMVAIHASEAHVVEFDGAIGPVASKFISEAKKAGIDGFILPDMSIEESKEYLKAAKGNTDTIFLISPNTSKERIKKNPKVRQS